MWITATEFNDGWDDVVFQVNFKAKFGEFEARYVVPGFVYLNERSQDECHVEHDLYAIIRTGDKMRKVEVLL